MTTTRPSKKKYWCWIRGDTSPCGVTCSSASDVDDLLLAATEASSRLRTHDRMACTIFKFLDVNTPLGEIEDQGLDAFLAGNPHALSTALHHSGDLGIPNPNKRLHFVIELPQQDTEAESPEPDSLGELAAFRFQRLMKTCRTLKVPSESSKSAEYKREQGDATAVLDGRHNKDHPKDNTGPPIDIFHPCFADFNHDVENLPVTDEGLLLAAEFVHAASGLYQNEAHRTRALLRPFLNALSIQLYQVTNPDGTQADDVMECTWHGRKVLLMLREDKNEISCGSSSPDVQGAHSIRQWWIQNCDTANVSCCPCFLISTAGPYFMVSGVVITQDVIVRPLTPYIRCVDVSHDESLYGYIARVFDALSKGYENLKFYWDHIPAPNSFDIPSPSRFHPWRTSYPNPIDGQDVLFKYLHPLETYRSTVTFLAELIETHDKIVVKFAEKGTYDPEPHHSLASSGYAPRLRYVGLLRPGSHLDMVVMDFVDGTILADCNDDSVLEPAVIRTHVIAALNVLHELGYVFGDLRAQNVMVTKDLRVKLIDMNWVGKDSVARYPLKMNMSIRWASGMGPKKIMLKAHDFDMLKMLF